MSLLLDHSPSATAFSWAGRGAGARLQRQQSQDLADVCQIQKSMLEAACAYMEMTCCPAAVSMLLEASLLRAEMTCFDGAAAATGDATACPTEDLQICCPAMWLTGNSAAQPVCSGAGNMGEGLRAGLLCWREPTSAWQRGRSCDGPTAGRSSQA